MREYHIYRDDFNGYQLAVVEDGKCVLYVTDYWPGALSNLVNLRDSLMEGVDDIDDVKGAGVAKDPEDVFGFSPFRKELSEEDINEILGV